MANDCAMSTIAKIGHAIDRLRIKRGLNKKELSEISGVDAGNLNRIISGKQEATYARMQKIAAALGVAPSTIYRMAETGLTEEEDRKAFLHALIDASGPDQVDAIFRRWPDAGDQRTKLPAHQSPVTTQDQPHRRTA
jgi:transcriptional regulator with XRE-family HTH domain